MQQGRKRFQQSQNNQHPSRASFSGNHESFPDLDFHEGAFFFPSEDRVSNFNFQGFTGIFAGNA